MEYVVKCRNPLGVTVAVYHAETKEEALALKKEFEEFPGTGKTDPVRHKDGTRKRRNNDGQRRRC